MVGCRSEDLTRQNARKLRLAQPKTLSSLVRVVPKVVGGRRRRRQSKTHWEDERDATSHSVGAV